MDGTHKRWVDYPILGPKPKKKRKQPEAKEQQAFFQWLSLAKPSIRRFCWAIPNGGKRNAFEAHKMKLQGVTPGVPDIFLAISAPWKTKACHGMFIEFKAPGKLKSSTQEQITMRDDLKSGGYHVVVVDSWQKAQEALEWYLDIERAEEMRVI